jgi:hypothetical protein
MLSPVWMTRSGRLLRNPAAFHEARINPMQLNDRERLNLPLMFYTKTTNSVHNFEKYLFNEKLFDLS